MIAHMGRAAKVDVRARRATRARSFAASPLERRGGGGQIADCQRFVVGSRPVRRYCGAASRRGSFAKGTGWRQRRGARNWQGDCNDHATKPLSERGFLDRYFGLTENGTNVRTEFIAGLTTFLTMVYIVFVNPQILGNAGMDKGAVFVATCIAAAVSTLVMALYANYPIALAPGMGLNAFFAFTVVLGYKYTWQQALAAVFCSGRDLLPPVGLPHPRIHHQLDPEKSEIRDLRRRRAVSRHHRARECEDRRRASGDAGHARRSQAVAGDPLPRRLRPDRGAQLPQHRRRHPDRHPGRDPHRPAARARPVHRHRVDAAVARADLPAARFLPRRGGDVHHRRVQFPADRRVRQCRHADRGDPSRRAARQGRQPAAHETGAGRRQLRRHVRRSRSAPRPRPAISRARPACRPAAAPV